MELALHHRHTYTWFEFYPTQRDDRCLHDDHAFSILEPMPRRKPRTDTTTLFPRTCACEQTTLECRALPARKQMPGSVIGASY